ncbi:MAG: hypothetical protein WC301_05550 [Candidatus Omnitrophota bacterium]|jgi:hypothetical protein
MEEAIFITNPSGLKGWSDRYSRIYFGNEFCEELIPSREELIDVLDFSLCNGLGFSFVTGLVTDAAIDRICALLACITKRLPGSEVIVNDWGMLRVARSYNLKPIIGRLLSKQRRDPRILDLIGRLPQKTAECLRSAGGGLYSMRFLRKNSVDRLEIDNLPQGIILDEAAISEGFHFSLYYPFNYLTTSRECLFNDGRDYYKHRDPGGCARKCRDNTVTLRHPSMPLPIYMKGNTLFIENPIMPGDLLSKGIDRIVYQPGIPM